MNFQRNLALPAAGWCAVAALLFNFAPNLRAAAADTNAAPAATGTDQAAEDAWQEVLKAMEPPPVPDAWRSTMPSADEIKKYRTEQGRLAGVAADKTKDFYTRFPQHPQANEARMQYERLLDFSVSVGNTNKLPELEALEAARLKDPETTEDDRFRIRMGALLRKVVAPDESDPEKISAALESVARQLIKEFPKSGEPYELLVQVMMQANDTKARALAREIAESSASDQVKAQAKNQVGKLDRVGKPFPLKFTDLKGETVDLEKLKGKVVLVDFWATWCGPCVRELPNVRAAYDKLQPKGFEILGISFDQNKDQLEKFIEREKMTWPQYFDGKGWSNELGQKYGINSIPAMWLVDKKGVLRDLNARGNLVAKVEKLLAE